MVGITLRPERIRMAPPEVRRWLENEIRSSLGLLPDSARLEQGMPHILAFGSGEVAAIYAHIANSLPVANLFFELGRQGNNVGHGPIEAHLIGDVLNHARLGGPEELAACLNIINGIAQELTGDPTALFCALDGRGHYFIASETKKSIAILWTSLLDGQPWSSETDARPSASFRGSRNDAPATYRPTAHFPIGPGGEKLSSEQNDAPLAESPILDDRRIAPMSAPTSGI